MAFAPITQELIKEALQYVLDESRHPLLLMSSSGTHQVGVLVGCLRRQQGWNLASILDEYRSFASPSARLNCEQFIELWDTVPLRLVNSRPGTRRGTGAASPPQPGPLARATSALDCPAPLARAAASPGAERAGRWAWAQYTPCSAAQSVMRIFLICVALTVFSSSVSLSMKSSGARRLSSSASVCSCTHASGPL